MKSIQSPIDRTTLPDAIVNLQDGLLLLVERAFIRASSAHASATAEELHGIAERLKNERAQAVYGEATTKLVLYCQAQFGLGDQRHGVVDHETAEHLNEALVGLGAFAADSERIVRGRITFENGEPAAHAMVRAYDRDVAGEHLLGETTTDAYGRYSLIYGESQFRRTATERIGTGLFVAALNASGAELGRSRIVVDAPKEATLDLLLTQHPGISKPGPELLLESAQLSPAELSTRAPPVVEYLRQQALAIAAESLMARLGARSAEIERLIPLEACRDVLSRPDAASPAIVRRLEQAGASKDALAEAARQLKDFDAAKSLEALIQPNIPIEQNPLLRTDVLAARLHNLGRIAGIEAPVMDQLLDKGWTIPGLSQSKLLEAVGAGTLTERHAERLASAVALYRLADEDANLAGALLGEPISSNTSAGEAGVRVLAAWKSTDWAAFLAHQGKVSPAGLSTEDYSKFLANRIAALFPTDALIARLVSPTVDSLVDDLEVLQPHLVENPLLLGKRTLRPLDIGQKPNMPDGSANSRLAKLRRTAFAFPGLGLADILKDTSEPSADRAHRVAAKVGAFREFCQRNAAVELLLLDFGTSSEDVVKLDFGELDEDDRGRVVRTLKAYQRIHKITGDVEQTKLLVEAGYDSAARIVSAGRLTFQKNTGLSSDIVADYAIKARNIAAASTAAFGAALDLVHGGFNELVVTNVDLSTADYFRHIDGFAELFGNQNFCACEHCRSVLSPAAYFVDLMWLVEKHVQGEDGSPISLRSRRPDLWEIPLTCANTNDLLAQLQIVCEIFAIFIAKRTGYAGNYQDLSVVFAFVDSQLAEACNSFRQPKLPALDRVEIDLAAFGKTRAELARVLGASPTVITAAAFGLSRQEYMLVTQSNAELQFLSSVYGIRFQLDGTVVKSLDVQTLLTATDLSRSELGDLIGALNGSSSVTRNISIHGARSPESSLQRDGSIQDDMELIEGLTVPALDLIHRFTRLWRAQDLTLRELVLTAGCIRATGPSSVELDQSCVQMLAAAAELRGMLHIGAEDACALLAVMPTLPFQSGSPSLFDRVFNPQAFVAIDGSYPQADTTFTWPSPSAKPEPAAHAQVTLMRLLGALQVDAKELYILIDNLWPRRWPAGGHSFSLNLANLSNLYRHTRLARCLGLSMESLFRLIHSTPGIATCATSSDYVFAIVAHNNWLQEFGVTLEGLYSVASIEIELVRHAPTGGSADPATISANLIRSAQSDRALTFADTIFTQLDGVTEGDSRMIVEKNSLSIVSAMEAQNPSACRLSDEFDPTKSLQIPNGISVKVNEAAARELLLAHHASRVIPHYLAAQCGLAVDAMGEVLHMTAVDTADPELARALRTAGPPDILTNLVSIVLPLELLFQSSVFDCVALQFVRENPTLFGIDSFPQIGVASVRYVYQYQRLIERRADRFVANELNSLLKGFDVAAKPPKFPAAMDAVLASVLDTDLGNAQALHAHVELPGNALDALRKLQSCAELTVNVHVGGDVLPLISAEDAPSLDLAAQALDRAIATACPETKEAINQEFLGRYRSSLAEYLMRSMNQPFKTMADLYRYFLIDAQVESCFLTSRLVAAISSLQLYVQRTLMNLEQDAHGEVRFEVDSTLKEEWEWRKNYRVWEANRKVFLWPESFLGPDTRDDKSPLFDDLESQLQQKQIDEQGVLDAYSEYLKGFEELAHLKIAGVYHDLAKSDKNELSGDVLHLIGATSDDPPIYYHRQIENSIRSAIDPEQLGIVWQSWRKIDINIPVRRVAPIVVNNRLHVFWVQISTTQNNALSGGGSAFIGYTHRLTLKYSALRLDGRWTAPQSILLKGTYPFEHGDGQVDDPLMEPQELETYMKSIVGIATGAFYVDPTKLDSAIQKMLTPRYDDNMHTSAQDGYTLSGEEWTQIYPEVQGDGLHVVGAGYQLHGMVDLFEKKMFELGGKSPDGRISIYNTNMEKQPPLFLALNGKRENGILKLYLGYPYLPLCEPYAYASLILDDSRIARVLKQCDNLTYKKYFSHNFYLEPEHLLDLSPEYELLAINCPIRCDDLKTTTIGQDIIISGGKDTLLMQGSVASPKPLRRIATTLTDEISRRLFLFGVDGLLDIETQNLSEKPIDVTCVEGRVVIVDADLRNGPKHKFDGPYGVYYREIFFHIPFLIASLLNSQGQYERAQRWFHYIFDPTATETMQVNQAATDRVWRYLPFRNQAESLRGILTETSAVETYRRHPFSPDAIARLRKTTYQKAVVMRYVDNLLEWGDSLFAQFEMETVNQATMLYVMAQDILGPAPAEIGACEKPSADSMTYIALRDRISIMKEPADFLIELEHETLRSGPNAARTSKSYGRFDLLQSKLTNVGISSTADYDGSEFRPGVSHGADWKRATRSFEQTASVNGVSDALAAFWIPANPLLLERWNRVADRLFKIRHCLDINGERRDLTLFAPEISPDLLIQARAEGLSPEDVLDAMAGQVPPYRFTFLIEKAKQFASTLETFGSALLSALEKRDNEQLSLLRTTHEQNLLTLSISVRQWEADAADRAVEELEAREATVTHRRDYFKKLVEAGLIGEEWGERINRHVNASTRVAAGLLAMIAGAGKLLPDVGSPFAMKYGGTQLGHAWDSFAVSTFASADMAEAIATSAGMEATFVRRAQEWKRQLEQAEDELAEIGKQKKAAELRQRIAQRAITSHATSIEQNQKILDFFGDKLTNLALYVWLSKGLRELYRAAYGSAYSLAKMAERAYRFERDDDASTGLSGNYWDANHGGLLAAGRLLVDLGNLERRFLETNFRDFEVEQSFSLAGFDPLALLKLKGDTATCIFTIPEYAFNLFYPGQYRRKIRSVRISIPCVAGPYTNVSATLKLNKSWIRSLPTSKNLTQVPVERTASIATSSANNDGGVFEMSFRDERYLPFEGVGAVETEWELQLPSKFRPFDYETISDVIVHMNYTAKHDDGFRTSVESALEDYLNSTGIGQLVSLRRDCPDELYRLIHGPLKTGVTLTLDRQLPYWLAKRTLSVDSLVVCVQSSAESIENLELSINGLMAKAQNPPDSRFDHLPTLTVTNPLAGKTLADGLSIKLTNAGVLAPKSRSADGTPALDEAILQDIYVYIPYKLAPTT
jgi:hypothetical protein